MQINDTTTWSITILGLSRKKGVCFTSKDSFYLQQCEKFILSIEKYVESQM